MDSGSTVRGRGMGTLSKPAAKEYRDISCLRDIPDPSSNTCLVEVEQGRVRIQDPDTRKAESRRPSKPGAE